MIETVGKTSLDVLGQLRMANVPILGLHGEKSEIMNFSIYECVNN